MKFLRKIIREIFRSKITKQFNNSSEYWEDRYYYGGNSGRGSYEEDAKIKANFLNATAKEFNLNNVIDIGCGDGNNLSLFDSYNYFGIDLSETVISKNKKKFINNKEKNFILLKNNYTSIIKKINKNIIRNESIILSFDVILHLVENHIYEKHLDFINKIDAAFCLVVSSNKNVDYNLSIPHVRHRNYSKDFEFNGWNLINSKKIPECPDNREINLYQR